MAEEKAKKSAMVMTATKDRNVSLDKIRNIGIIAHIDAGKTTTTERLLFETGRTYKLGSVDDGTTVTDWMVQERERGITIVSAAITAFWDLKEDTSVDKGHYRINLIDTPGHIDFTAEVERSLRVLDGALMVFDGRTGVESQSETVWRQADKYNVPRICVLNKLNLIGADFEGSIKSIRERLRANASPVTFPIGQEHAHRGVIDLIRMKALTFKAVEDASLTEEEIPADLLETAKKYRNELIEKVAEFDDETLTKYLEGQELSVNDIKRAIRKGVVSGKFFPVFGGDNRTAESQLLLDGVVEYLPSPTDVPPIKGINPDTGEEMERKSSDSEPFAALAFKLQNDPFVGQLTFFRVYSGTIEAGSYIYNSTTGNKERLGRIVRLQANKREEVKKVFAGEIAAAVGLKEALTSHTFCDENHPIILETIKFAEPVVSLSIEPKTKADQEKMGIALKKLGDEDPTFRVTSNPETGQTLIAGMGELHLEIMIDRMKREFNVEANVGQPQVAYRETITGEALDVEHKYAKQSGGKGQYGHVRINIKPLQDWPEGQKIPKNVHREPGYEFIDSIKGGVIPGEFIPAVQKGVKEAMDRGIVAGFPMTGVSCELTFGSYHDVDSSEIAYKIAASQAFQEAAKKARPVIMEPVMRVEVVVPEKFMGDVTGSLSAKRGQIEGMEDRGMNKAIKAIVPLSEMFGYTTQLRSMTEGRGSNTMEFARYEPVPPNVEKTIVDSRK